LAQLRAQIGEVGIFVFSAGAFWLVANGIRDILWLKRLVWLFLALGAIYVATRLIGSPANSVSAFFVSGSTGSLFWTWLVALAAGQALFNHHLRWQWRVGLLGLVAATFFVALTGEARSWTSGWLPAAVTLGLIVWFRWPRASLLLGVGLALAGFLALPALRELLIVRNQYSILTRGAAFAIVLEIIKSNPLLGVGPANYYFYTPLYPILGYYIQFNSHNQYVDIVAQTGIVGLLFFAWWALTTARVGWSLRKKFTDGFARGYVYAALAGLAGMLLAGALGDWFLPFVYNIGLSGFRTSVLGWLFLGGLVALEQIARQPAAAVETA
jgi:O-antigen ligase